MAAEEWDLEKIESYFRDRVNELIRLSNHGTPWDIIGGAMLIEWLAQMSMPIVKNSADSLNGDFRYSDFIETYMPSYASFKYATSMIDAKNKKDKTTQDLPLQIYIGLRNPLVHFFSMVPEKYKLKQPEECTSYRDCYRPGGILLCHRTGSQSRDDGIHLARTKNNACVLRSPDFLEDIGNAIETLFQEAGKDKDLGDRISGYVNSRPPLGVVKVELDTNTVKNILEI